MRKQKSFSDTLRTKMYAAFHGGREAALETYLAWIEEARREGDFDEADKNWRKARFYYASSKKSSINDVLYDERLKTARRALELNQPETAQEWLSGQYEWGRVLCENRFDSTDLADVWADLAIVYGNKGNAEKSKVCIVNAITLGGFDAERDSSRLRSIEVGLQAQPELVTLAKKSEDGRLRQLREIRDRQAPSQSIRQEEK
ncbi:MAG: hypothetical protein HY741_05500 [Chloroflexi bacterium]|nr:hypothetical protein [Chloroflexota bacterium]